MTDIYVERDRRRAGVRTDDVALLALTHANGVRSHLWMNAVAAQPGPRFRVLGSENAYVVYGADPQEAQLRAGRSPDQEPHRGAVDPEHWGLLGAEPDARRVPSLPGDYRCYYRAMADALLDGAPVPVDARDALETMKILERARLVGVQAPRGESSFRRG